MKIKRLIKYYLLGESLKEIVMNRILDKIYRKVNLTDREKGFLELYNHTVNNSEDKDWMMLSKSATSTKVKELIELDRKVICDLHDRNGKIGLQILNIVDDIESDFSIIIMKGEEKHKLQDKFLYNLIYSVKKNQYSLQEHDEYFEKLTVGGNED
jgi:hypothetical protein